jgi:hypothetical protein
LNYLPTRFGELLTEFGILLVLVKHHLLALGREERLLALGREVEHRLLVLVKHHLLALGRKVECHLLVLDREAEPPTMQRRRQETMTKYKELKV